MLATPGHFEVDHSWYEASKFCCFEESGTVPCNACPKWEGHPKVSCCRVDGRRVIRAGCVRRSADKSRECIRAGRIGQSLRISSQSRCSVISLLTEPHEIFASSTNHLDLTEEKSISVQ